VSASQLERVGAHGTIERIGGLKSLLSRNVPSYNWNMDKLLVSKPKATQSWLKHMITKLFPDAEVIEDYLHPELIYSNTRKPMQIDVFLPKLSLALEYQGIQHYEDLFYFGSSVKLYQEKDAEKRKACQAAK
jgi:hypothetical protein